MTRAEEAAIRARLAAGLVHMGTVLNSQQIDRLILYLLLLQRWNKAYNLTAVRETLEMVSKHVLDSLSLLPFLYGKDLLDLGTGAGLPGIPLAVAAPEQAWHLLDSNGKKTRFLRQASMELGLENVDIIRARMESYLPRRKFATIVSRAAAPVSFLAAAAEHLLAHPARLLVMKGLRPADAELEGLKPRPETLIVHRLDVPFLAAERHLIEAQYD